MSYVLWPTAPLRRVAGYVNSSVDKVIDPDEIPAVVCNYTDAYYGRKIQSAEGMRLGSVTPRELIRFRLEPGDVLITKDSETADDIGVPALIEGAFDAVCGYHLTLIRPRSVHPEFLYWVMNGQPSRSYFETAAHGVTRYGLTLDNIGSLPVPMPPAEVQTLVADFLHRETDRIDQLVANKRRMIELLEAELASASAEAIAHGLNTARLRQSPLEWFASIPDDWQIVPLRRVAHYANSSIDKKTHDDEQPVRVCNYTDVYYGSYIENSDEFRTASATKAEVSRFTLRKGDVLMTKDSETASDIGIPALIDADLDAVCGYHLTQIRPRQPLSGEYLYWVLMSPQLRGYFETVANGVTRFGLTLGAIGDAPIPLPPLHEQHAISRHLRDLQLRASSTTEQTHRQIELLGEYRQALITAAVIGQIDEAVLRGDIPIEEAVLEMSA